jgi:hypothetical protein
MRSPARNHPSPQPFQLHWASKPDPATKDLQHFGTSLGFVDYSVVQRSLLETMGSTAPLLNGL